ncbi:39S ribosomal protein L1, mitochondrial isoform X2 [Pipistrellus kuhlii]|uniref:39S ribosomal protein L1, mitochondrial isoform X2 n=1 Tax=Pipistrellus kuhlii TaxID=59472 RepID=UPI00174F3F49|nr:39S ribosomal protein L1, mitochondrial isoform X2 [Pipistrellus kuhlii]
MANMAAAVRCLGRVVIHQRHNLSKTAYQTRLYPCSASVHVLSRHFAAAAAARKPERKTKKGTKEKAPTEKQEDIEKIKSIPFMEGEPEDDVYLKRLYPRQIYDVEKAIHLLKKFQILDFTYPKQGVYLDLTLDMSQGKKNASEIKIAEEHGAAFAGGTNLVKKILDDEIEPDFYIAVPEIMSELNPLKKKLKKRFPKLNRNSIGRDIPKMLELYKTGIEIKVDEERENFLSTKIATLDMSGDQITANLQAVINDVCRHRPLDLGPFVVRAFLRSSTSEGLLLKMEPFLPKEVETKESSTVAA